MLDHGEIRSFGKLIAAIGAVLMTATLVANFYGVSLTGRPLGGDFTSLYIAGKILNVHGPERLYDLPLQDRMFHDLTQADSAVTLWYAQGPLLAFACRPLAVLPFAWACVAWAVAGAAFYVAGFMLAWPRELPATLKPAAFWAAVSFYPFLLEAWYGGQISFIAFFLFALASRLLFSGRQFAAGAVLAGCLFKPTILLLVVPAILAGKRVKMLGGLAAGSLAFAALAWAAVGLQACGAWLRVMSVYARFASGNVNPFMAGYKFIDLNHFLRSLPGVPSRVAAVLLVVIASILLVWLAYSWRRFGAYAPARQLLWAATISWGLILNAHVMAYDAILIVVGVLPTAAAVYTMREQQADEPRRFRNLAVLLYAVSFVAAPISSVLRIQLLTIVVGIWGVYQLRIAGKIFRSLSVKSGPVVALGPASF